MKIGIASTGRSLSENVYKRFWQAPVYLIYDSRSKKYEHITSYCKYENGCGPQAAQIFINKKVDLVLAEEIDEKSFNILQNSNIEVYSAYPGTCMEALDKLDNNSLKKISKFSDRIKKFNNKKSSEEFKYKIDFFKFVNIEMVQEGKNRLFEDWEMTLRLEAEEQVPQNWQSPVDFSDSIYQLRLEVADLQRIDNLMEFEFGWCNLPEKDHPNIPHRCTFGYYCNFNNTGVYEHIARVADMEKTSVNGLEEPWNWEAGWDSPFCLIKPYGQNPFPVKFKLEVTIFRG